jgi:hypothetical protein
MAEASLHELVLLLFGGEPLLSPRVCRELLFRAADHGLASAAISTNGILLTPLVAEDLWRLGLKTVQVTFDGDRAEHNRVRATRSGHPTFDLITTNIARAAAAAPIEWKIRVNISPGTAAAIRCLTSASLLRRQAWCAGWYQAERAWWRCCQSGGARRWIAGAGRADDRFPGTVSGVIGRPARRGCPGPVGDGDGADSLSGHDQHGVPGDRDVGAGPGLVQPQAVLGRTRCSPPPTGQRLLASHDLSQARHLDKPFSI